MGKTAFIDGNQSEGIRGTIVTAAFLNAIFAARRDGRDADGSFPVDYAVDTGSANAYVLALNPPLVAYAIGMPIAFKPANTNTGASTININNLGVKSIRKNGTEQLAAGDLVTGLIYCIVYDGVNFQIVGPTYGPWAKLAGDATQLFSAADGVSGKQVVNISQFANLLASNGYQKLPGGLIIQWGFSNTETVNPLTVTLPITYPNAGLIALTTEYSGSYTPTTNMPISSARFVSQSQIEVATASSYNTLYHHWLYWLTIGW